MHLTIQIGMKREGEREGEREILFLKALIWGDFLRNIYEILFI